MKKLVVSLVVLLSASVASASTQGQRPMAQQSGAVNAQAALKTRLFGQRMAKAGQSLDNALKFFYEAKACAMPYVAAHAKQKFAAFSSGAAGAILRAANAVKNGKEGQLQGLIAQVRNARQSVSNYNVNVRGLLANGRVVQNYNRACAGKLQAVHQNLRAAFPGK